MKLNNSLLNTEFFINRNTQQYISREVNNVSSFEDILFDVTSNVSKVNNSEYANVPYGHLAENGVILHKGAVFVCDAENSRLCLGDVSDSSKCISIPLSGGGSLVVNRDNLNQLAKAIDMFTPEDINRIMRAISQDNKCKCQQLEIDEQKSNTKDIQNEEASNRLDQRESEVVLNDRWTMERSRYEYNNR